MTLKRLIKTLNKIECETNEIRDLLDYTNDEDSSQEIIAALYRIERSAKDCRDSILEDKGFK